MWDFDLLTGWEIVMRERTIELIPFDLDDRIPIDRRRESETKGGRASLTREV